MTKIKKPKVGFFGLTGCAGCQLSVIFNEDEILSLTKLIDIRAFPFIKEYNKEEKMDYVFVEGLVGSNDDAATVKRLRDNSEFLVALGACAHTGCIPAYRNFTLKENYEHLMYDKRENIRDTDAKPIDAYVKVDLTLPGCPPDKRQILSAIKTILLGNKPHPHTKPVCVECRLNSNDCLLIQGKPCLGPVTSGGCNAVCINGGFECWGCRGSTGDANYPAYVILLRSKGYKDDFIKTRMKIFTGLKITGLDEVFK
jgi:sulfhydrogenase subunit delta